MQHPDLEIACVVSQPFAENCFIATASGQRECLIFDPGFAPDSVIQYVDEREYVPAAILNTHGHSDHIAGNEAMKARWPDVPLIIGHGDADKLTDPEGNLSRPFGIDLISPPADQTVAHGDRLELGQIPLEVRETPGHSSGHVVFVYEKSSPFVVFGGDVLFRGGVGRYDFPDSDGAALMRSIREQLFSLPDDTIVLPGHGDATTTGFEKQHNPFLAN